MFSPPEPEKPKIGLVPLVCLAAGALAVVSFFNFNHASLPRFWNTEQPAAEQEQPPREAALDEESFTPAQMTAWGAVAAQKIMRFDYRTYQGHLKEIRPFFTPSGWKNFMEAINGSNLPQATAERKLSVSLALDGLPQIQSKLVHRGLYIWYVSIPSILKCAGPEAPAPLPISLTLKIVRVPSANSPDGIAIEQWIANLR